MSLAFLTKAAKELEMIVIPVVIVILLLFGAGVISLLSIRSEFARELNFLKALESELRGPSATNPTSFHQAIMASPDIPRDSVVAQRVETVFKLSGKNAPLSLSEISELAISAKEIGPKTQLSNFVLSALLISGLGGTFLAFREILGSSDLGGTVSNGVIDMVKYQAAVTKIYEGFNGAFWASICGVFGTVCLLFLRFMFVIPVKDRFFNRLDLVTQSDLVPMFSILLKRPRDLLPQVASKLDTLITGIQPAQQSFSNVAAQATAAVADLNKFASTFGGATDKFSNLTGPTSPLLTAMTQLFDAVEKYESRYYQYETALKNLVNEVKEQNVRSAETQLKFVDLHTTLESAHNQHRVELEQLHKSYKADIAGLSNAFAEEVRKILQNTGDVVGGIQKLTSELHTKQDTYANDFKAATDKLDSAMGKMEATARTLNSAVSKIDAPAQQLINSISQLQSLVKNIEASVRSPVVSQAEVDAIQVALRTINRTLEKKKFTLSLFGWRL